MAFKLLSVKGILIPGILIFFILVLISIDKKAEASLVTRQELVRLARLVILRQESLIEQSRQTLLLISKLPQVRGTDSDLCHETLAGFLSDEKRFANFGIIDPAGKLFCSALPFEKGLDVSDRAYFKRAVESNGFSAGNYQIGRVTRKPTVNFGYAFNDAKGRILGVSYVALDLAWLAEFAQTADLPIGSKFIITDSNGIVLARYPSNQGVGATSEEENFPLKKIEYIEQGLGILEVTDKTKEKRFLVVAPLKLEGQEGFLHLIISVPKKNIVSFYREFNFSLIKRVFESF